MCSELQTAVDKGRDCGAAFSGRDTGVCMLALVVCCGVALEAEADNQSRHAELRASARERRARFRPLYSAVWSSLYMVLRGRPDGRYSVMQRRSTATVHSCETKQNLKELMLVIP
ncbi:hypothetical protein Y032_0045g1232 [Ancylostoma ceylanicum]|uniref:Uncharacterized protein n=1 Tax=Ancylostoma ceylanicum TaxID=53326 RepID=A0A016UEN9_9BILA|nr:hypothetical protein Y032_0045g1232 [Ancylostoma ceylanicum]